MSINRLTLLQQASTPAGGPEAPDDLQWLVRLLRQMMAAVAAEEGDTLQKAGMIARLGNLILRASGAAETKRAYKELLRRYAELEERLTALEEAPRQVQAAPQPVPAIREKPRPAPVPLPPVVPRGGPLPAPDDLPTLVIGAPAGHTRDRPAVRERDSALGPPVDLAQGER